MRLPLATDLKTSISDVTKDARLINAHAETRGGLQRVKKRPGALATGWNFTTPIQGLFGGGLLYLIYNDEFSIVDVDNPPPGEVLIGDIVGGYYAMIDNPSTPPGPGDAYWSASPPGADRWRVNFYAAAGGFAPLAIYPQFAGDKGASIGAASKRFMEQAAEIPTGVAVLGNTGYAFYETAVCETYVLPTPGSFTCTEYGSVVEVKSDANREVAYISYPGGWPGDAPFSSPSFVASSVIGHACKGRTVGSFTITASGTEGRILANDVMLYNTVLGSATWVEITGCDQPEYNGVFLASQKIDGSIPGTFDVDLYFSMPGTPASSPATGSGKQLTYYTKK